MTGPLRVGLFLLALVVLAAAAAAVGRAVGPLERPVEAGHGVEEGAHGAPTARVAGLSAAAHGFRLVPERRQFQTVGHRVVFAFRIDGAKQFDVIHARRMHLIVVRRDLQHFQHLHPRLREGTWSVPIRFPAPGWYRAFADFSSGGRRAVLATDVFVPGDWDPRPVRNLYTPTTLAGPFLVALARSAGGFRFTIWRDGSTLVSPDPYLGARGHLVVLRARDLAYIHAHPHGDALEFETELPGAGEYGLFLEFASGGRVRTAVFGLEEAPK